MIWSLNRAPHAATSQSTPLQMGMNNYTINVNSSTTSGVYIGIWGGVLVNSLVFNAHGHTREFGYEYVPPCG